MGFDQYQHNRYDEAFWTLEQSEKLRYELFGNASSPRSLPLEGMELHYLSREQEAKKVLSNLRKIYETKSESKKDELD